jgi:outer membrane protein assembly factor BamE (lipoprotein component of BamABCDE complex)
MKSSLLGCIFAALCAAILAGCMSQSPEMVSGSPIDPAKVALIVKGKTTRAEVEALFGKPDAASLMPDGRRSMAYNYSDTKTSVNSMSMMLSGVTGGLAGGSSGVKVATRTQTLQLYVSKDGVVEDFEFSDNQRDTQGAGNGSMKTSTH